MLPPPTSPRVEDHGVTPATPKTPPPGTVATSAKATYFGYLATEGLMATWWPHHMEALGMDAAQIGQIFSVRIALSIIAQPLLSALADRTGSPRLFLKVAIVAAFAALLWAPWVSGFAGMALLLWLQAPPRSVIVPLMDATTIREVGPQNYGRVRLWGSIGYGVAVAAFGLLSQSLTYRATGALAIPAATFMLGLAAIAALSLPRDTSNGANTAPPSLSQMASVLRNPALIGFLLVGALHWSTVIVFNIFLSIHTQKIGLDPSIAGWVVATSIAAEIAALYTIGKAITGPHSRLWSLIPMPISAARWLTMALTDHPLVLIATGLAHFFSFGTWIMSMMATLGRFAPPSQRAALQGIMAAAVFGVGGTFGSWAGGALIEATSTQTTFAVAALVDLVALALAIVLTRPTRQKQDKTPTQTTSD